MQKTFSLYTFALITLGQSDGGEETDVFTAIVFDSLRGNCSWLQSPCFQIIQAAKRRH